jgi:hypothetical protein
MIAPFTDESEEDFLGRVAQALSEHFDVVQIFAQTETSDHTDVFNIGYGNVLARQKQMENWLEMMAGQDDDEEEDDDE